jgi:hypothetical protein
MRMDLYKIPRILLEVDKAEREEGHKHSCSIKSKILHTKNKNGKNYKLRIIE